MYIVADGRLRNQKVLYILYSPPADNIAKECFVTKWPILFAKFRRD
jgi:hypothetical protein